MTKTTYTIVYVGLWFHQGRNRAASSRNWILRTCILNCKHKVKQVNYSRQSTASTPSKAYLAKSPARPYLLNVPKQCYQLETNIQIPETNGTFPIQATEFFPFRTATRAEWRLVLSGLMMCHTTLLGVWRSLCEIQL